MFVTNSRSLSVYSMILIGFIAFLSLIKSLAALTQDDTVYIGLARIIETHYLGISDPAGLTFCSKSKTFLVVDDSKFAQSSDISTEITIITPDEDLVGSVRIADYITDPVNMAFDKKANRLLIFQSDVNKLIEIKARPDGYLDPDTITEFDAQKFGLQNPQGMTVDPVKGHLFILDSAVPEIVHIKPHPYRDFDGAKISHIHLEQLEKSDLRGIAFNPANGHLYLLNSRKQMLYELTRTGKVVAKCNASECELQDPQGMVFAPSGDMTDDPSQMSLYIANCSSGYKRDQKAKSFDDIQTDAVKGEAEEQGYGNIIELSFTQPVLVEATSTAALVRIIDTSQFSPPSPDPSGITYLPSSNRLLISDGEVDETPIFTGVNLFEMSLAGNLLDTLSVMSFSNEPTGITINPANRHLFISDDVERKIFELDPGPDGIYDTSDDRVTSFNTRPFGSADPEGVAYDPSQGVLFIADGVNREVYRVTSGSNGIFDGIPPSGDDLVTHFDTLSIGVDDPEGIEYNPDNNRLYLVGKPRRQLAELTTTGTLTQVFDTSAADIRKPAGLAFAPGSLNSNVKNIYIAARGTDNDSDPNENDGKVYEISLTSTTPGNQRPTVSAGPDQTITLPASASLNGTVSDDGLPNPPGVVTTTWSKVSGPGTVTFGNVNAVDTTASFSIAGTYVLRLTASDSVLSASDDVTITVLDTTGGATIDIRVAARSDDAEESALGNMTLGSSDLELVLAADNQTVGMRFNGVSIPKDATILNAYIQFKADEIQSGTTSLTIQGEDVNTAATFTSTNGNISSRIRTAAAVSWSPAAWTTIGEASTNQRTSDLSAVIQEIVNRTGWSSGNSIAVIITGTGKRVAESFDGDQAGAPLLHVVYSVGQTNQPPTVNAGPNQTITLPASAILDGSVSDDGLPNPPGIVTTTWSKVSGPGTVTFGNVNAVDTTASFSIAGTYVLRLTASDSVLSASDDVTITVLDTTGGATIDIRVAAGSDDAEESASGGMILASSDLDLVLAADNQTVGMRFNGVSIPKDATILNAYIQFKADETQSGTTSLTIQGEDVNTAATFASTNGNISSRIRTTAAVSWSPAAWTIKGEAGPNQRTSNISAVIQEIVNRTGWSSGNSMAIIITGTGRRVAESFEGDSPGSPLLHVEFQ